MAQKFDVTVRQHPWGTRGVNSSLEETAKGAAAGAIRPEVRTWAVEVLDKARKAGRKVNNDRGRATEILKACQAKLWVPDPVFAEYITPARLLACEKHGDNGEICIKGEDCDGLVVLCAAAFMSVGLHSMIVGHGYGADKQIRHVLTAVRVDGKWNYADPSVPEFRGAFPLGECHPFTHERLLSVPNVKVLCDADKCITNPNVFNPEEHDFVTEGVFVGIAGVPEEVAPEAVPFEKRLQWIEGAEDMSTRKSLGALGGFGYLGLTPEQQEAAAVEKGFTNTELILMASVAISAIGLIWNITRDKRASTSGTPGAALANNPLPTVSTHVKHDLSTSAAWIEKHLREAHYVEPWSPGHRDELHDQHKGLHIIPSNHTRD